MIIFCNFNCSQWKNLWQLTSGIYYETPQDTVVKELRAVSTELLNGPKSNGTKQKSIANNNKPSKLVENLKKQFEDKLTPFIEKLKQHLDLQQNEAWEVFCSYLLKEYHGSTQALLSYLASETNTASLLDTIWHYYALERMTQLKVLKNVLEHCESDAHPYCNEYKTILNEIGYDKLRKSYVSQLTQLVSVPESPQNLVDYANSHARLVLWSERKIRETNEVLQILLLIIERNNVRPEELKILLNLFKSHSFGRQQQYLDLANNKHHADMVNKVIHNEIAIFLKCIDANCS